MIKKTASAKLVLIPALVIILISGGYIGYKLAVRNANVPVTPATADTTTPPVTAATAIPNPYDTKTTLAPYIANGDVTYIAEKKLDTNQFIASKKAQLLKDNVYNTWPDLTALFTFYDIGTVKQEGKYLGWKLIKLQMSCDGPCFSYQYYRFVQSPDGKSLVMLANHSENDYDKSSYVKSFKNVDTTTELKGLKAPKTIPIPNSQEYFTLQSEGSMAVADQASPNGTKLTPVFVDPTYGQLYQLDYPGKVGCLLLQLGDGTYSNYEYNPQFFDRTSYKNNQLALNNGDQKSLSESYAYPQTGCGMVGSCYPIVPMKDSDIVKVGSNKAGTSFYIVAKPLAEASSGEKNESIANEAQKILSYAYTNYIARYANDDTLKASPQLTFSEYSTKFPVLFWKDPLGRWSYIQNTLLAASMAECGKPVIYLYPTKTTDVSVKVGIDRLTVSDPAYGANGWNVRATSDSQIYNYADGKTYPYLFWEGQSDKAIKASSGFVIEKKDAEKFLNEKLTLAGLTTREKNDFKEFWLPHLRENAEKYIFISFIGTSEFNKIAPLDISPAPETLIRLFMYYMPTSEPIATLPQHISAIPRHGFTVVEWGGTSSKQWKK